MSGRAPGLVALARRASGLDLGVEYNPHTLGMAREDELTIGGLARLAGVGRETLRYYERIGLLPAPGRRKGGYRRYGAAEVARLRFIRRAVDLGFTLAETGELLALRAREGAPCAGVRSKAHAKLEAVEQKLLELTELRDAIAALVRACRGDRAVEHCTILAALGEGGSFEDPSSKKKEKRTPWSTPSKRRAEAPAPVSRASRPASAASKSA